VLSISQYHQDESALGRMYAWGAAWRMIQSRPFTGVGIGDFSVARGMAYSSPGQESWLTVHNIVLQAAAEMGVLGVLVYAALVGFAFGDNRRTRRTADLIGGDRGRWYRNVAHGIDAGLAGFLVTSLFATTLYYPHLYLLAGLAVALKRAAASEGGGP
jgi:O-antigen ligase